MSEKIVIKEQTVLDNFCYQNGYQFVCTDWGADGVKIEFMHPYEGSRAVILPPDKALEYMRWMTRSLRLKKLKSAVKAGKK